MCACLPTFLWNYVVHLQICMHVTLTLAWSSSGSVAIRYLLLVVWMMSCLHIVAESFKIKKVVAFLNAVCSIVQFVCVR